jgi:hypothetical protein
MPLKIDHTAIVVPADKLNDVVKFLLAALEPLGLKEMMRPIPNSVGLGDQTPFFWVTGIEGDAKTLESVLQNEHTAFSANGTISPPSASFVLSANSTGRCLHKNTDNKLVDQFHEAAIKAGGKDNGAPGPRPQYHPGYYGAFVRDPVCGIDIEVVNHNMGSYQ